MKNFKLLTKTAIVGYILLVVCYSFSYGQSDTIKIDTTINKMCLERGHVSSGVVSSTLMYCPPYTIDTDSTTIQVYPACNWISFTCKRCGKPVSELEPERRVVIWRKKNNCH